MYVVVFSDSLLLFFVVLTESEEDEESPKKAKLTKIKPPKTKAQLKIAYPQSESFVFGAEHKYLVLETKKYLTINL